MSKLSNYNINNPVQYINIPIRVIPYDGITSGVGAVYQGTDGIVFGSATAAAHVLHGYFTLSSNYKASTDIKIIFWADTTGAIATILSKLSCQSRVSGEAFNWDLNEAVGRLSPTAIANTNYHKFEFTADYATCLFTAGDTVYFKIYMIDTATTISIKTYIWIAQIQVEQLD